MSRRQLNTYRGEVPWPWIIAQAVLAGVIGGAAWYVIAAFIGFAAYLVSWRIHLWRSRRDRRLSCARAILERGGFSWQASCFRALESISWPSVHVVGFSDPMPGMALPSGTASFMDSGRLYHAPDDRSQRRRAQALYRDYQSHGLSKTKRLLRVAEALGIRGATQKRLAIVRQLLGGKP